MSAKTKGYLITAGIALGMLFIANNVGAVGRLVATRQSAASTGTVS